jgi:hypothetical protein
MTFKQTWHSLLAVAAISFSINASANIIEFETFKIRNSNATGTTTAPYDADLIITENANGDGFYAMTDQPGQKVGYGTNAFDGMQINLFNTVDWNVGAVGTGNHPYLNMWVTDNAGNYAVIASENAYMGTDFQVRNEWKIFEFGPTAGFDWLFNPGAGTSGRVNQYLQLNGANVTLDLFSDDIELFTGPVGPTTGVGTGAPRGGFGFNVIYGDTQANFVDEYAIKNLTVEVAGVVYEAGNATSVPEPSTVALFALGIIGLCLKRRK